MKKNNISDKNGFTLIELLVVISIIGILASVVLSSVNKARDKANIVLVIQTQKQLQNSLELYHFDIGFYPPDVNRGWDPGFAKKLPYNLDTGADCETNPPDCPVCPHCPANWVALVQAKWKGPYMGTWPANTPWGGKYDYNHWPDDTVRYGCPIKAGVYVGGQGDYSNNNTIPPEAEQEMLDKKLDHDGCLNGESQILLFAL